MMTLMHTRCAEGLFDRPPELFETGIQNRRRDIQMTTPFSHCSALTVPLQHSTGAAVIGLFGARGPARVALGVMAVIVDALKRMQWRGLLANVSEKGREVLPPSITHPDAPASVVWKGRMRRTVTPILDRGPHAVFAAVRLSMLWTARSVTTGAKTAAAFCASALEPSDDGVNLFAALAPTADAQPLRATGRFGSNHREFTELFPFHSMMITQDGVMR